MIKLGIVGASGLVGQSILEVLKEEKMLKKFSITLIASGKSSGKVLMFNKQEYRLVSLDDNVVNMCFDYVIFSAGDEISKQWVPRFAEKGTVVIDNTNAFRRFKGIPLIVPEINFDKLSENNKIISNPNCSTIQLAVVLDRIMKQWKINDVVVSSYQSVSGAGRDALKDLINGSNLYFKKGIKNNIIPQIGDILENGFCVEEDKIMFESNKVLNSNLNIIATTVRVPIAYCHGESVYIRFGNEVKLNQLKTAIECDYIKVCEDIVYPSEIEKTNLTYVCRIRAKSKNEVVMFVIANNLRRGAAYNAVLILKKLLEKYKVNG